MGDHDPALQHHLLDLAQAQREPVIQPHTVTNDLRREAEPRIRRHVGEHQLQPLPALGNQSIISTAASSTKLTMPTWVYDRLQDHATDGRAVQVSRGRWRANHPEP
jgi:hypothetical protein